MFEEVREDQWRPEIWNQSRRRGTQFIYTAASMKACWAVSTLTAFPAKGLSGAGGGLFFWSNTERYGHCRPPSSHREKYEHLWLSAHVGIQVKYKGLSWGGGVMGHASSNLDPVICSSVSLLFAVCFMVCMRSTDATNLVLGSQETTAQTSSSAHPGAAGAWCPLRLS